MSSLFNGSLFKNEKCDPSRNQPNFTGVCAVRQENMQELLEYLTDCQTAHNDFDGDHIPLRMSAWAKTSKNGKKFMSISFQADSNVLETKGASKVTTKTQVVNQSQEEDLF
tara:strand:+ start:1819 stop:2151 length:333 start_codon:yes stop_codon:yes gene_type:complete